MTDDDLTRRAIIAAHGECGCEQLNPGEQAIVDLWRADVERVRDIHRAHRILAIAAIGVAWLLTRGPDDR